MESKSRVSLLGRSKDRAAYYFSIDEKNVALDLIKATHLIKETPAKERNCALRNTVIVMKAGHGEGAIGVLKGTHLLVLWSLSTIKILILGKFGISLRIY